ncbi:YbaB/EbfC family nucleoid-associated protein [Longispora albida]|uniref:YbaB/EbfC family nucleoid-associated protein n=1 Tax=Longispora albida TaxID=203523 RepID=UPI0003770B88|nr:YbaB/EbfC family nucleoid-associated protein [Longispora albida]
MDPRQKLTAQIAQANEFAAQLRDLAVEHTSSDYAVTVTVRPGGVVTGVQLSERATRHTAASLSETVTSAIHEATGLANAKLAALAAEYPDLPVDVTLLSGNLPEITRPGD